MYMSPITDVIWLFIFPFGIKMSKILVFQLMILDKSFISRDLSETLFKYFFSKKSIRNLLFKPFMGDVTTAVRSRS